MPSLKEAAVVVAGKIIDVEDSYEFGTENRDGVVVLIATGDGHAKVKLNSQRQQELQPRDGQPVCWVVRFGANGGRDRDAKAYSSFVRPANEGDLDKIVSAFGASNQKKQQAA